MTGVALITGGQQGIGFAIADALVNAGFTAVLGAHVTPDDPIVIKALRTLGPMAHYVQHDVTHIDGVAPLLDRIEADHGPVTTFISNAGVGAPVRGDMLDLLSDNYDVVMNVNLRGAFFLAQGVARRMLAHDEQSYRCMAFITSVSAEMVSVERAEYCLSKSAASMMARLYAARLAPHGVGVFELRPGIIATDMTAKVHDAYTARIENGLVPAARWGHPQDIGQIIVPLATGQLGFATGAVIPVDGGLSIARL